MPSDFSEVVRACYEAVSRGDLDFVTDHCDPEIEITEPSDLVAATTYHGHAGLRRAIDNWAGEWDAYEVEIERLIEGGRERVIVIARHRGRGPSSGAAVELRNVNVFTGRDGKTIRWEMFSSLDDAFAAIGLRKLKGET